MSSWRGAGDRRVVIVPGRDANLSRISGGDVALFEAQAGLVVPGTAERPPWPSGSTEPAETFALTHPFALRYRRPNPFALSLPKRARSPACAVRRAATPTRVAMRSEPSRLP